MNKSITFNTNNISAMTCIVLFSQAAIDCVRRMSVLFENNDELKKLLSYYEPLNDPDFFTKNEQRLARMAFDIANRRHNGDIKRVADDIDVIQACNILLSRLFGLAYMLTDSNGVQALLDAYPITLLCQVCNVRFEQVLLLGEAMKHFIEFRNYAPSWLPPCFHELLDSHVPLTGHAESPITELELQALFRYLGTRKRIYVQFLLGSLSQLRYHEKGMTFDNLKEEDIMTIYNSSWLHLLCIGVHYKDDNY
jgi:hypothetical protein